MNSSLPYKQAPPGGVARPTPDPSKFTAPGTDFVRHVASVKSQVSRPGMSQGWSAATHDPYYDGKDEKKPPT